MSMILTAQAMKLKIGNPARKLVLLKLADNANDDGVCFPSYKNIAEHCEISERSAINHINALIEMGLVSKKRRKTENGDTSNLYILHLGGGEKIAPQGVKQFHSGGENHDTQGVKQFHSESINITNQLTSITPLNPPKGEKPARKRSVSVEKFNAEKIDLPDWVNRESWIAYCQMRKAKRVPIKTERTLELCLLDLEKHSQADPQRAIDVLEQSTKFGWTGLFALQDNRPKAGQANQPPRKPNPHGGFEHKNYEPSDKWEQFPAWLFDSEEERQQAIAEHQAELKRKGGENV